MLYRGLRDIRIILVALGRLPSPGERSGQLPAGSDLARVECACRPALLVDAGFELLGVFEMAPAALQCELAGGVPGQAYGRGIQRSCLNIPAVLVRLARIEAADLDLHTVEYKSAREHAKADVRGVEPMVADRCLGRVQDRFAVHEGGRTEGGFSG